MYQCPEIPTHEKNNPYVPPPSTPNTDTADTKTGYLLVNRHLLMQTRHFSEHKAGTLMVKYVNNGP